GGAPAPRRRPHRPRDHAAQRAADAGGQRVGQPRPGGDGRQALLGEPPPRPRRVGHGRARPRRHRVPGNRRRRLRPRPAPAALPVQPGRHHLRGLEPDPAQHHRRAGPRPAEGATLSTTTPPTPPTRSAPPAPPAEPPGHDLLAGRVAVVTAAAGTGIGSATARRLLAEGATVVISDAHERRVRETADALAGTPRADGSGSERPLAVPCDVTDEDQVQALFDAVLEAPGRGGVAGNNARPGGPAAPGDLTAEAWRAPHDRYAP